MTNKIRVYSIYYFRNAIIWFVHFYLVYLYYFVLLGSKSTLFWFWDAFMFCGRRTVMKCPSSKSFSKAKFADFYLKLKIRCWRLSGFQVGSTQQRCVFTGFHLITSVANNLWILGLSNCINKGSKKVTAEYTKFMAKMTFPIEKKS